MQKQNKKNLPKEKKILPLLLLKHIYMPASIDDIANIHIQQPNGSTQQLAYIEFNSEYTLQQNKQSKKYT